MSDDKLCLFCREEELSSSKTYYVTTNTQRDIFWSSAVD